MNIDTGGTKDQKTSKVFFPNLNGVRAIAALMVVVAHTELHKKAFNIPRIGGLNLFNLGKVGVTVFFSLSGFLITYLLLEEKKKFVKVNFKDFYIRRILRIWPLYFLVIIFGFFIYPKVHSAEALLLSVFFMPNIAFTLSLLPAIFDPIWSIGIEEQFYIFHPHFFRIKKTEHILYGMLIFMALFLGVSVAVSQFYHGENIAIKQLFYYARYDNMMIGGIFAVLYFNTKNEQFDFKFQTLFNLIFNKYVQLLLVVSFFGFVGLYITYTIPRGDIILALLAVLLIINLCDTDTSIRNLTSEKFQFTGRVSYGIYLLHKFPLFLMLYLVKTYLSTQNLVVQNLVLYAGTLTAAIGLAFVSYHGYEKYFLLLKKKFQKVPSGGE